MAIDQHLRSARPPVAEVSDAGLARWCQTWALGGRRNGPRSKLIAWDDAGPVDA